MKSFRRLPAAYRTLPTLLGEGVGIWVWVETSAHAMSWQSQLPLKLDLQHPRPELSDACEEQSVQHAKHVILSSTCHCPCPD
jgi:hypothetical protein